MTAKRRPSTTTHGYTNYTYGCRCEVCRKAKADYMRARRTEARHAAHKYPRLFIDGIKHGTPYGYDERGCRCLPCIEAGLAWKNGKGNAA